MIKERIKERLPTFLVLEEEAKDDWTSLFLVIKVMKTQNFNLLYYNML